MTDANLKTVTNGGSVGKTDGTDILFTDSSGTLKINHELESYNPVTGQVIAWVRVLLGFSHHRHSHLHLLRQLRGGQDQQKRDGGMGQQLCRRVASSERDEFERERFNQQCKNNGTVARSDGRDGPDRWRHDYRLKQVCSFADRAEFNVGDLVCLDQI